MKTENRTKMLQIEKIRAATAEYIIGNRANPSTGIIGRELGMEAWKVNQCVRSYGMDYGVIPFWEDDSKETFLTLGEGYSSEADAIEAAGIPTHSVKRVD